MLDDAFEALKKLDWGTDLAVLAPIDDAVASHDKEDVRRDVESRLIAALQSDVSRDAKDYVCRKLMVVGSAAAVPPLAAMLADASHSHMARFALERIQAPEAGRALRDAAATLEGSLKIGAMGSIGARGDAEAVNLLGASLQASDAAVARGAAMALAAIGTAEAAAVLRAALLSANGNKPHVTDALLACAESLRDDHKPSEALSIYQALAGDEQPRLVRLAATRGILTCASMQG